VKEAAGWDWADRIEYLPRPLELSIFQKVPKWNE